MLTTSGRLLIKFAPKSRKLLGLSFSWSEINLQTKIRPEELVFDFSQISNEVKIKLKHADAQIAVFSWRNYRRRSNVRISSGCYWRTEFTRLALYHVSALAAFYLMHACIYYYVQTQDNLFFSVLAQVKRYFRGIF